MLDEKTTQTEDDVWNEASNPPEKTYDLSGKIDIQAFKGAYQSGTRGALPFNPQVHQKAHTIIKMYVQPLAEIDIKYPEQVEYESPTWADWGKTTWPSLKTLGINDAREINDRWARVTRVPTGKQYAKKDKQTGQPTGEMGDETTWKFVTLFADEDACRAAYVAAGGAPSGNGSTGTNVPLQVAPTEEENARKVALAWLDTIVIQATKGMTKETHKWADAKAAVQKIIDMNHEIVGKYYDADTIEAGKLITEHTGLLPF